MYLDTTLPARKSNRLFFYNPLARKLYSENIGSKFDYFKFQNLQNPFAVVFNAISMEKLIARAIENNSFSEKDIFQHNGVWKCFEARSNLDSLEKSEFLINLNDALKNLREALFSSTHIILTYGT